MRKTLTAISILCAGLLCGIYGFRVYNVQQVDAMAALIPWLMVLLTEVQLCMEDRQV